jgi:hypothetical protein
MQNSNATPGSTAVPTLNKNQNFTYDQLVDTVGSTMIQSGSLTGSNGKWTVELDKDLEGFDATQTFTSWRQAVEAILPVLLTTGRTILQKAVA